MATVFGVKNSSYSPSETYRSRITDPRLGVLGSKLSIMMAQGAAVRPTTPAINTNTRYGLFNK